MSGRTLVVRQGELERMETAIARAHDDLLAKAQGLFDRADGTIAGWQRGTGSRDAHDAGRLELQTGVDRLAEALTRVRTTLAAVREQAHDAEVRNVALID